MMSGASHSNAVVTPPSSSSVALLELLEVKRARFGGGGFEPMLLACIFMGCCYRGETYLFGLTAF